MLAVVWAVSHFHAFLWLQYGGVHAVRAVLETPSANGKHARWWSKLFGAGLKSIKIIYHQGKDNLHANTLSCSPVPLSDTTSPDVETAPVHVSAVQFDQMSHIG